MVTLNFIRNLNQPLNRHGYKFTFADISGDDAESVKEVAKRVFEYHTETDVDGMLTTFMRDAGNGDIYAVAIHPSKVNNPMEFPENKMMFINQFEDWVFMEQSDCEQFGIRIGGMIGGWLPQYWNIVKECLGNPMRSKSKKDVVKKWRWHQYELTFDPQDELFMLRAIHFDTDVLLAVFTPNEAFQKPE